MIRMTTDPIDPDVLRRELFDPAAGGYCAFEGWVRNENEGHEVLRLEYEGYEPVAVAEGKKILAEAAEKYPYLHAHCVHRTGMLEIGDCAVWVGVASAHRDEAFKACRYIIDELKHRLPIWKNGSLRFACCALLRARNIPKPRQASLRVAPCHWVCRCRPRRPRRG
jgi:molybdopterin synthase catalytic subunit